MVQAINNKPMTIYGDGEQTRAFSYIDDCLEPFWNAAISDKASKQIINVGGEHGYSINEAMNTFIKVSGYNNVIYKEARHEVKYAVPNPEKSKILLGYKQSTSLEEGLRKMWEWAQTQPNRKQFKWENYEINKGIYSYWK